MKKMMACGLLLTLALLPALARAEGESLIKNGDFQAGTSEKPDGWQAAKGDVITYPQEGENRFMRLKVGEPGKMVMVHRTFDLKPDDKTLILSFKVRYQDIKVGEKPYFDGRVVPIFRDENKKDVKPLPKPAYWKGSNADWTDVKMTLAAPEGAKMLSIMFTLFNAQGGTLDFDDVKLERAVAETQKAN